MIVGHFDTGSVRGRIMQQRREAIEMYEQIGMPKHLEMAEGLLRPM